MNIVIKKWIEPYVLLETAKKYFEMQDFTFDGFSKDTVKEDFLKKLAKAENNAFGLYMKNVNKFYLFSTTQKINIQEELLKKKLNFNENDFEISDNIDLTIKLVDIGKAEAGLIIAD